jgi:asparagine synthetase B (glutamine-hydrolysing)
MCGIAGISGTELMESSAARDLIARMLGVIEHRDGDAPALDH